MEITKERLNSWIARLKYANDQMVEALEPAYTYLDTKVQYIDISHLPYCATDLGLVWDKVRRAIQNSSIFKNTIIEMEDAIHKGHTKNISDNDIIKCPICRADMINLGIHEGRRYYRCEDCNWVVSVVEK